MGLLKLEDVSENDIRFVRLNQKNDLFICRDVEYPGVDGMLQGFAEHEFIFGNKPQKKFDIFLTSGDGILQIQFGYSYTLLSLINCLMAIKDLKYNDILKIIIKKNKNGNPSLQVFYTNNDESIRGQYIKWRFSYDELKLSNLGSVEQEARKNKILAEWTKKLIESLPSKIVRNTNYDNNNSANETDLIDDLDVPF